MKNEAPRSPSLSSENDKSSFSLLSRLRYLHIFSFSFTQSAVLFLDPPPPPLPPVSQRTQLIKTDKQAHLDPSEAAGCIISPDKEKGGLGISDIVILLGRLRGNHRELGGLYSRGTNAAQESCRIHIFNLRIEMKLKVSLTALQFPLPFLLILVHSHFHQQLFSPPQKNSLINHKDTVNNQPASGRSGASGDWRARCFPQKLLETDRETNGE